MTNSGIHHLEELKNIYINYPFFFSQNYFALLCFYIKIMIINIIYELSK